MTYNIRFTAWACSIIGVLFAVWLSTQPKLALYMILAVVVVFGIRIIKKWSRSQGKLIAPASDLAIESPDQAYKITRGLYYLGTAMICQLVFRPALSLTISDCLYLLAIAFAIMAMMAGRERLPSLPRWMMTGLIVFLLGAFITAYGSGNAIDSIINFVRVPYIVFLWFTLGALVLRNEKHVRNAMLAWVLSICINGLIALLNTKYSIPFTDAVWGRQRGFADHVNDLGGSSGIAWAAALYFATQAKRGLIKRILGYLPLLLTGIGAILSGTVSGFLVIGAATLLWFSLIGFSRKLIIIGIVGAVGLSALTAYQINNNLPTPIQRITETTNVDNQHSSVASRLETYKQAVERVKENPFIGVGFDKESKVTTNGFEPHNMFLGVLYKGGLLSLAGILIIVLVCFKCGINLVKNATTRDSYILRMTVFITFISSLVFSMTAPALYQRYIWIPAALLVALHVIQNRRTRDAA